MNFDTTAQEAEIIEEIAKRAVVMTKEVGVDYSKTGAMMDVAATHCNGNPLRLKELLEATDFNFAHDIFGIHRHLNRKTGQLEDCFSPRFSVL